jgi:hypothetical protein
LSVLIFLKYFIMSTTSTTSIKPCGPASDELQQALTTRVIEAQYALTMQESVKDMDAPGAVERFQGALRMSLCPIMAKCVNVYTEEEWTKLVWTAQQEGPPTAETLRLTYELQDLRVRLGEITLDEAFQNVDESMGPAPKTLEEFRVHLHRPQDTSPYEWDFAPYPYETIHRTARTVGSMFDGVDMPEEQEEQENKGEEYPGLPTKPPSKPKVVSKWVSTSAPISPTPVTKWRVAVKHTPPNKGRRGRGRGQKKKKK